ncbi:2-phospho-L-lactate guanylyltransferase [Georgenia sp. AZ-5]|uniref:2-phospho-L-lactate guanylyltransferase n=1 Tax=Georgenia sp. AZ-5 TaxID=3367526 RepID=UPI00375498AE
MPLRDGRSGKTRLAGALGPQERSHLIAALGRHVVTTLLAAGTARVLVVTRDPQFATDALAPVDTRVEVVRQPETRRGLNAAVSMGHELAATGAQGRLLVIHADLPLLTPDDVFALLRPPTPVVLAPDRTGKGTNALVLDQVVCGFRFWFGSDSRAAHTQEAAALGLHTAMVRRRGTSTDLDTPADLAALPETVRSRLVWRAVSGQRDQ